jgi:hypothetical protein
MDQDPLSDCGGNYTTTTQVRASGLAWDDKWVNQVFGGRATSSSLGGAEANTGSVAYDYSGCAPQDHNADNRCSGGATKCTAPNPGNCTGAITQGQRPTLSYTMIGDHTMALVNIGFGATSSCYPAFQTVPGAPAPMFAVFDLYPSATTQTTTLSYALTGPSSCSAVATPPPPPDTLSCTITPSLMATVKVTGLVTARQAPASEHLKYDLLAKP